MDEVITFLAEQNIKYRRYHHPAVYTVEEAALHRQGMEEATHTKNLFLKDSKQQQYYLLTTQARQQFRLNQIRKTIRAKKLRLATEEELEEILGLQAGSVSPFGLLNDQDHVVEFIISKSVWQAEKIAIHPNTNTQTIVLTGKDFQRCIRYLGYEPTILQINQL